MEEFVRENIDLESNIGSRAKISYSKPLFPIFGSIKFLEKIKIKPFFLSWAMKNSKGNREIRVPGWLVSIPPIYDRGCISKYIIQQRGQCWSPQNEETLLLYCKSFRFIITFGAGKSLSQPFQILGNILFSWKSSRASPFFLAVCTLEFESFLS